MGPSGPENGGLKSGPCLIAGFQPLTVFHPSYWNAYKAESGATFSIDMVRLKLSFINGKGEWLSTHAQTFDCAAAAVAEARSWCARFSRRVNGAMRDHGGGVVPRSESTRPRSRIAELTRRSSQKKDWEEGRCERKLPSTLSLPKSASAGGLGMGFPYPYRA